MEPRPILLFSAGCSGSTLVQHLLSHHHEVAWLPARILERRSCALSRARAFLRAVDLPLVGGSVRRALAPGEVYPFWERLAPGFAEPGRDLTAEDVVPAQRDAIRAACARMTTARRPRLLLKITGWPRLGFLRAVFPLASFVHVARDPRAVACSFLGAPWWRGRAGPSGWRWGPLSPAEEESWERHGRTPLALACLQQRIYWRALEVARRRAVPPGALLDVRYEDLCTRPSATVDAARRHCALPPSPTLANAVVKTSFRSTDERWRHALEPAERRVVEELLEDCVARYGRLPSTRDTAG